jgi:hypothetical protein
MVYHLIQMVWCISQMMQNINYSQLTILDGVSFNTNGVVYNFKKLGY